VGVSAETLIKHPLSTGETLGHALPDSIHAVSMSLPRWSDVVGYESHDAGVWSHIRIGYPRFVYHPLVKELIVRLNAGPHALPFPSERTARLCAGYIERATGEAASVVRNKGIWGARTTEAGAVGLRAFWQHTGLIVSSRQAEALLEGRQEDPGARETRESLRRQLAALYDCNPDDVFLTPTGMAAHYAALRAVNTWRPGRATVQLGFPYADTLKLQQKVGFSVRLLHKLETIPQDLKQLLAAESIAACFCEIPGNPLLGSADIPAITPFLRERRVPLVIDDVVTTPLNIDTRPYAALVATSLTKYIAGTCDVMGGAIICNPASPFHRELKPILEAGHEELLWGADARVLDAQAKGFPERMRRHNANGLFLAEKLRAHPGVERVWYPKWECAQAYEALRRPEGGYGALLAFLPRKAAEMAPRIYDAMDVCKGPSLGTIFTLACPFTVLAHYSELDWAEACGVPRYLIRISAGLEDAGELWGRLERALNLDLK
jgi:cystathionine gamma-synthase